MGRTAAQADKTGAEMFKISLVAMFVVAMATITLAASALPVPTEPAIAVASLS